MIKKFEQFLDNLTPEEQAQYNKLFKLEDERTEFINNLPQINKLDPKTANKIIDYVGHEGFTDYDEAVEYLIDKIKEYKKFSDPITLYRVIAVKDEKHINTEDMGEHYTPYESDINGDMLLSIGSDEWDDECIPYILEVSVPLSEIDTKQTLVQNLAFPNEHEVNLKNKGKGAKLIKVKKY